MSLTIQTNVSALSAQSTYGIPATSVRSTQLLNGYKNDSAIDVAAGLAIGSSGPAQVDQNAPASPPKLALSFLA